MKSVILAAALSGTLLVSVLIGTFNASLPAWCADPAGSGNWIVAPLCGASR